MTIEKPARPKAAAPATPDARAAAGAPGALAPEGSGAADLGRVLDVKVELSVELGRRKIRISDVLALGPGAVIDFPKAAEEPLDILVNGQLVARGEAVVLSGRYGVRIVEVVSPNERLKTSRRSEELAS